MNCLEENDLFLRDQSLEEGLVGEEAVLVLGVGELLEESLGVLLGNLIGYIHKEEKTSFKNQFTFCMSLLTQIGDEILELGQHHGTVLVLVVEFAQLEIIVDSTLEFLGAQALVD